ncbi:hypothetical protein C1I98_36550 [Spongiactinospora gelatinilytica]|uniref:Uncharacterized protein n=1 Tax=Spongiactinospora gelatinilytica TaxID=2666298 RepID=A0A2W2F0D4_9ACTN|nr:hypothetical protein [Spongiactinospora gelatinilytica]PZG22699.1 hypothetical protein C1I98_36550 [Spongiactinospora gelatinilytica]
MQALDRSRLVLPMVPGVPERAINGWALPGAGWPPFLAGEHRGEPIRLADPARAGAAARALAAALLVLTTATGTFADTDASREMT